MSSVMYYLTRFSTVFGILFRIALILGVFLTIELISDVIGVKISTPCLILTIITTILIERTCSIFAKSIDSYFSHLIEIDFDPSLYVTYIILMIALLISLFTAIIHEYLALFSPYIIAFACIAFLRKNWRNVIKINIGFIKWLFALLFTALSFIFFPPLLLACPAILAFTAFAFGRRVLSIFEKITLGIVIIYNAFLLIFALPEVTGLITSSLASFSIGDYFVVMPIAIASMFEEIAFRVPIPTLGIAIPTFYFPVMHIPKVVTLLFTSDLVGLKFAINLIYMCSICYIALLTIFLIRAFLEGGIFGAWLTHMFYNSFIYAISIGSTGALSAITVITLLMYIMYFIIKKKLPTYP